jgi:RNA polymerase sigma-70 factor (ECF subfamily)
MQLQLSTPSRPRNPQPLPVRPLPTERELPIRRDRTESEMREERQLIAGLLADEPAAWRELNARYAATLHRAIGRVIARFGAVTGSDDVREVYAKLCLSLLSRDKIKLRSFDPERGARLGSWLVRLAMQASYDHLRRIKRNPVDVRLEIGDPVAEDEDPYAACWERQRAAILARMLGELSEREREFFQLYFGEGLDPEVVAARMGISVATVYTKRHKLERRLQALVEAETLAA